MKVLTASRAVLAFLAAGFGAAPVRAQAVAGSTAQEQLWDAARAGDTLALKQALAAGARIDSLDLRRNPNGRRALNWAAWDNRADAVRFLVANGATVNLANITGFTPLHHAAENGSLEAAQALLKAGADPTWPNNAGETPAEVARKRMHPEVAAAIEAATAKPQ
jgi:ankyrin repeat protein